MADKCNETLCLTADRGEGSATITCILDRFHKGLHCEQFRVNDGYVIVLWEKSSPKE